MLENTFNCDKVKELISPAGEIFYNCEAMNELVSYKDLGLAPVEIIQLQERVFLLEERINLKETQFSALELENEKQAKKIKMLEEFKEDAFDEALKLMKRNRELSKALEEKDVAESVLKQSTGK